MGRRLQSAQALSKVSKTRNPNWSRDELILALDLYFRHSPLGISENHPDVVELSKILNKLGSRLGRIESATFRNKNGVYMKLCNFLRFDPTYQGVGLKAGGKLEEEIWSRFFESREELGRLSDSIKASLANGSVILTTPVDENEEQAFPEGAVAYRIHLSRERNRDLVRRAKERAKRKNGRLVCAACEFDFHATYGQIGEGYIECHHVVAVSELKPGARTRVEELAMLCANCHRMIHRRRPWLHVEELRGLVRADKRQP